MRQGQGVSKKSYKNNINCMILVESKLVLTIGLQGLGMILIIIILFVFIVPAPTKTLKYNLMFNIISRKNHTNNIKYMNSLICKNTLR